jgi:uncharacterized protein YdhG (YjbR/CyaY superfamily)
MAMPRKQFKTIDAYIGTFPKDIQRLLKNMRRTIRHAAPEAVETISYQMPAFKLHGRPVVYFAAFKNHIGLYPPVPNAFKREAAPYEGPKGNLKFPLTTPIPLDLVKRIVRYRVKEAAAKAKKKK